MGNGVPSSSTLDTAVKLITQLGFPVVVAAALLYYMLTSFQTAIGQIAARMSENAKAIDQLVLSEQAQLEQSKAQTQHLDNLVATLRSRPTPGQ